MLIFCETAMKPLTKCGVSLDEMKWKGEREYIIHSDVKQNRSFTSAPCKMGYDLYRANSCNNSFKDNNVDYVCLYKQH